MASARAADGGSKGLLSLNEAHAGEFLVGGRTFQLTANPVFGADGTRLGTVVEWVDRTEEVAVEAEVEAIVNAAKSGHLGQRVGLENKSAFFGRLGAGINELLDVSERVVDDTARVFGALSRGDLEQHISADYQGKFERLKDDANATVSRLRQVVGTDMARVLGALSRGDLTQAITTESEGTFAQLASDVNATVTQLREIVGQIDGASASVASGASEIAQGTHDLSERTEQQASSLEETASSMEEMTATVKQNAESANEANQLALEARGRAESGDDVVAQAVSAMTAISEASTKIADIIGVIDEIAFQTNLLALNASVEAARAGEQGRGFAVVASEVRNLAGRSASAAKEIKELIEDSVAKVHTGTRLVNESGDTLRDIVSGVNTLTDVVGKIARASREQSAGIEQVNKAVMSMEQVTQQNAAMVEEASSASAAMGEQANKLRQLIAFFRAGNDGDSGLRARAKPIMTRLASRDARTGYNQKLN